MAEAATVLVIDDNALFVDNLGEILGDAGYRVIRGGSCKEALEVGVAGFDVALIDLRLPDGSGIALAPKLKELMPDAEVILLTGHASTESAAEAVRAGAFAYLVKPAATPDILLTIEQATRKTLLAAEKRELGRRAQRAEKLAAVGTLAAGLSHEIRNPLNAAALQLTVLERRLRKTALPPDALPQLLEPLALVQGEIRRLSGFLEEFLQFARPREIDATPLFLDDVVARVVDLLRPEAAGRGVQLESHPGEPPTLYGDAGRLQQAILNLVLNAVQAVPAGGWVRIATRANAPHVEVSVEDNGPGVPPELREKIFEPFFTTKASGSGLGLPLVHSVVQQHGGTLHVETSSAGGARFVIRLPRG
jgi:two-component system, NtrC family, sensor histidine kinase HydH